jgi:hypothetical protein
LSRISASYRYYTEREKFARCYGKKRHPHMTDAVAINAGPPRVNPIGVNL